MADGGCGHDCDRIVRDGNDPRDRSGPCGRDFHRDLADRADHGHSGRVRTLHVDGDRAAALDDQGCYFAEAPTRASGYALPSACRASGCRLPIASSARHGLATTSQKPANITRTNKVTVLTNRAAPQSHVLHVGWPIIVVQ